MLEGLYQDCVEILQCIEYQKELLEQKKIEIQSFIDSKQQLVSKEKTLQEKEALLDKKERDIAYREKKVELERRAIKEEGRVIVVEREENKKKEEILHKKDLEIEEKRIKLDSSLALQSSELQEIQKIKKNMVEKDIVISNLVIETTKNNEESTRKLQEIEEKYKKVKDLYRGYEAGMQLAQSIVQKFRKEREKFILYKQSQGQKKSKE